MNKLYVVGIGPGSFEDMTIRALNVLNGCDVIIGYTVYVELVRKYFKDAEFLSTPMRKEKERCIMALEQAAKGQKNGSHMQRRRRGVRHGGACIGAWKRISER